MAKRPWSLDDTGKKLAVIRAAVALNLTPAVDIEQMLAESERGYRAAHLDLDLTSTEDKP